MTRHKVVYTDAPWARGPDGRVDPSRASIERRIFGEAADIHFGAVRDGKYLLEGSECLSQLRDADALVICRFRVTAETLRAAGPSLRVVARQGVGYDNLNEELLRKEGIVGFNIPDYCVDEVATHSLALVLALERNIIPQHDTLRSGRFDVYAGGTPRRLRNCTAGVIGLGRIGSAVAARLRAFYGRVIAADPFVSADMMAAQGVERVSFERLLGESDVVLLHCWLDESTERLIDSRAIARMKRGALLVNAARGALVDASALLEGLRLGAIGGAGIDVFSPEDPWQDPHYAEIVQRPELVVTSHRAFLSSEAERSQRERAAEGVLAVLRDGRPPVTGHRTAGVRLRVESMGRP